MSKRRDDEDDENQENLMILRLPEHYAKIVKQAVNKGNLRERLQVDIKDDCRNALIKIEKEVLAGHIVDLPCIVECQKTIDNKTFYKCGDICQMVLVKDAPLDPEEAERSQERRKEKIEYKKCLYSHGLTPPLKNVRKKRFRQTAPKKIIDDPEVEKEVRRLLRADISAISVETKLVYDKPPGASDTITAPKISAIPVPTTTETCDLSKMLDETLTTPCTSGGAYETTKELLEMFDDLSSEDSSEDEKESVATNTQSESGTKSDLLGGVSNIATASQEAHYQLETLDRRIANLEMEVSRTTNSFLKSRLQDDLNNLKKERQSKLMDLG